MKVACIASVLDYSGAAKMMAWLSNQFARNDIDVSVICLYSNKIEQNLDEKINLFSLRIVRSHNRIARNTIQMVCTLKGIKKVLNNVKPDVIVSFLDSTGYYILLLNKLLCRGQYKIIASERSDPNRNKGISKLFKRFCMNFADALVYQTNESKDFYNIRNGKTSFVIANPVVTEKKYTPVSYIDRKKEIVTAGRVFFRQKRQDLLIQAFEMVASKHPDIALTIYGDGENLDALKKIVRDRQLNNVYLPGSVKNVKERMMNSLVFVLSSDYEGIPNSLIEAMSVGLPCVATDCKPGGARVLIRDGINGFIVQRNNPAALAEKILLLVENETVSNEISKEAVKIVETFSEKKIAQAWMGLLENLMCYKSDFVN